MLVKAPLQGHTEKNKLHGVSNFAKEHLSHMRRRTKESYAEHGMEVAEVLKECMDDPSLLSIALLHDIQVLPNGEELLKRSPLTEEEKHLIRDMFSLRRLHIDENTEDLDQVIDTILEHPKLLPLRMAHRLNDIRHIDRMHGKIKLAIAKETLHMYAAIAGRLGMDAWRYEMEDVCFKIVHPKTVQKLQKKFDAYAALDETCLKHASAFLKKELRKQGIHCVMEERRKALYSTYRKMIVKKRRFEELTDRLALRIITNDTMDCYRALAVVHSLMHPIPGKLKDYIGAPKENGYKSIHTVVYPLPGVSEQPIEIQIRTKDMHEFCEFGVVAHGEYKNALYALNAQEARVDLFRNLQTLHVEARSPEDFEKALRMYFREDHMAIFDHHNNLYHLKQNATALDFISLVFGEKLSKLKFVRINGRERPINTQLHDGDIVEGQFGRETRLSREWLKACTQKKTRENIRKWIKVHA